MKVVEVSRDLSAKLLGKYLCDLGWEVLVYDDSTSVRPYSTSWQHITSSLSEGKTRLHSFEDMKHHLSNDADILVENVGKAFFAHDDGSPTFPGLHVSLPPYASQDADHADFAHDEAAILAASGVLSDMGLNRTLLGIRASFTHLPLASVYGSLFGLCALLSEVVQGHLTSSYVEVPLASAVIEALVHNSIVFPVDSKYLNRRKQCILQKEFPVDDAKLNTLFDPFFTFYDCRDGRKIYLVCPAHDRHQLSALKTLGVSAEVERILPRIDAYGSRPTTGIGSGNLNAEQATKVRAILKRAFARYPAHVWERRLGLAKVPAIMVRSTEEWNAHPHVQASGLFRHGRPAPAFWSHVLRPRSSSSSSSSSSQDLSKIRVVDATNVIAGPTISAMLARFGCDVVKIDTPTQSYAPEITVVYGLSANVGKRSMLLDLRTPSGKQAFEDLLRTADVLVVNTTTDGLSRMGLSYDDLARVNPHLIVTRFDAWGGPREVGEWSSYLGYDDNVQAASGIMVRYGGSHATCEEHAHVGTIDTIAGVCGAAATLHALYRRATEGVVCEARTSLAAVSQYVQYPFLVAGELPCVPRPRRSCMGVDPFYCVYELADAHVTSSSPSPLPFVDDVQEEEEEESPSSRLYSRLASWLKRMTYHELRDKVRDRHDLYVTRLRDTSELRSKFTVSRPSLSLESTYQYTECMHHPVGGRTVMVSPVAMRLPIKLVPPIAPKYGTDTVDLLHSLKAMYAFTKDTYSHKYLPRTPPCDGCRGTHVSLSVIDCAHQLCDGCIRETSAGVCPCCRETSSLLETLRTRLWIEAYARWRKGSWCGSVTRSATIPAPFLKRSRSL